MKTVADRFIKIHGIMNTPKHETQEFYLDAHMIHSFGPPVIQHLPQDCDLSNGDKQCSAKLSTTDRYLCCRFIEGHSGPHKTLYDNGREWLNK